MTFTDDDLKRLKKMLNPKGIEAMVGWRVDEWRALLARLESAEKVCSYAERWLVSVNPNTDIEASLAQWRKAAGRDK